MTVVETLASNSDSTQSKDYSITFPQPFGELPSGIADKIVIVATIELTQTGYSDAYTVNTFNITKEGFTARVTRVDEGSTSGWGMLLELNYIAQRCTVFEGNEV